MLLGIMKLYVLVIKKGKLVVDARDKRANAGFQG
jgi:hypothetical protein